MRKTRVLVLYGGDSPEREVSIHSGQTVATALEVAGYEVNLMDTLYGFEELDKYIGKVDVVFPILHGVNGEDGVVQAELEKRKFKYLGSDSRVSKKCFDKVITHKKLTNEEVLMPAYDVVTYENFSKHTLSTRPYVLKPVNGGSSLDTQIVRVITEGSTEESRLLLKKYQVMIIEELISGVEITVPVLDNKSLPVIAIIPPANEEFTYENKYNDKSQEICPAPLTLVDSMNQIHAQEIALKVHTSLGVRHLSRTDIIINKDNQMYVLEINTMPGLRPQSLFPKAAAQIGLDMPALVTKFIEMVEEG